MITIRQPDPAVVLAAWRDTRKLSRAEFCLAILRAGLVTPEEAVVAAQGQIPAPLTGAIAQMPEPQRNEARVLWAGLTEVQRNHPLVLLAGEAEGLDAAALDALFGWPAAITA
ncbi:hypothetical protein [Cypionkella sp.]|uniref:hypothetical protein n=1 Tax=Cypionkella sp. TaxID=2811411 RepID=UPI00271C0533|nr:hypothetical protein [Cypionkella sp.]MDO8985346.1 hypothetical protein [Cypionkella sp.]